MPRTSPFATALVTAFVLAAPLAFAQTPPAHPPAAHPTPAVPTAAPTGLQHFEVRAGGSSRVVFTSDAPLETIDGVSTATSGSFTVDLANPGHGLTGTVQITTASLRTGSDMRDEHLRGANWLDAEHNPNITFELRAASLPGALRPNTPVTGTVQGTLTVHGVHHDITVPVTARLIPLAADMASMAQFGINADMLRVQTTFHVNLSDYGVSIMAPLRLKVSNDIGIRVDITAFRETPGAPAPAAH